MIAAAPQAGSLNRPRMVSGFTLIELIAVIVILAVLSATAATVVVNLRSDARLQTMASLAGSVEATMTTARAAWRVRGEGPSVVIDGVVIPVINGTGDPNLDGTPTAIGLYLLTKCGTAIPPIEMVIPCASMPRMSVYLRTATHEIFTIWFTSDNVVFC